MFKENTQQFTLGEHLIYQNLPEDVLFRLNKLIEWRPFEKILSKLHPAKVDREIYNPLLMFKILIIQQIYGHSDPEVEMMLKGNLFYRRFLGVGSEFITGFTCTLANVHDLQVVEELIGGEEEAIYGDKAYDLKELKRRCRERDILWDIGEGKEGSRT